MSMITPTRFGLKYAPVPTLALEYEIDEFSAGTADGDGATSLYVYDRNSASRAAGEVAPRRVKKLHVVELPALTKQSEIALVARQLQQDNRRFLAPDVVKENQLVRLLERLLARTQPSERSVSATRVHTMSDDARNTTIGTPSGILRSPSEVRRHENDDEEAASDAELEGSAMDESIAEVSVSASVDASNDHETSASGGGSSAFKVVSAEGDSSSRAAVADVRTATAISNEGSTTTNETLLLSTASALAHDEANASDDGGDGGGGNSEADQYKAEADAVKIATLRKDDDVSDGEEAVSEEDIQSEELEYFSEDGSDEDSF